MTNTIPAAHTLPSLLEQQQQLEEQLTELFNDIEDLTPEEQTAALDEFQQRWLNSQDNIADKVNSWCWVILKLQSEAEYFRSQEERFAKLKRSRKNRAESLKGFLTLVVKNHGGKLPTRDFPKLGIKNNGGSAPLILNEDYSGEIPSEFRKDVKLSDLIDGAAVRAALKAGEKVPFARLGEAGQHLGGLK